MDYFEACEETPGSTRFFKGERVRIIGHVYSDLGPTEACKLVGMEGVVGFKNAKPVSWNGDVIVLVEEVCDSPLIIREESLILASKARSPRFRRWDSVIVFGCAGTVMEVKYADGVWIYSVVGDDVSGFFEEGDYILFNPNPPKREPDVPALSKAGYVVDKYHDGVRYYLLSPLEMRLRFFSNPSDAWWAADRLYLESRV
jgi:hypothetical protein